MNTRVLQGSLITEDANYRPPERRFAIEPVKVTATDAATAHVVVTAGDSEVMALSGLVVSNSTGAAVNVSFGVVDAGDTLTDAGLIIENMAVEANGVADISEILSINPGRSLVVYASAGSSLRVAGWVTVYA